jgi:predicted phosphoribosyltransferase
MRLQNRQDAGQKLAPLLKEYRSERPIVLGIPRGGVIVAAEIAQTLGAPLDVLIVRKIGAPTNEEVAIGAVMPDGSVVLDEGLISKWRIPQEYIQKAAANQAEEIQRRQQLYRRPGHTPELTEKTVILVDDGIATGYTMEAAVRGLRKYKPKAIVIAVAVAPREVIARLQQVADAVVCLDTPEPFFAVGQFYKEFDQTSDEQVIDTLHRMDETYTY